MAGTKIPKQIFTVFPPEPENRMKLMLNVFRHEPLQVVLASYMDYKEGQNPTAMKRQLSRAYAVEIPNFSELFTEVLQPAHLVKATKFPDYTSYEPSHYWQVFGARSAEFTLKYTADNQIFLGDIFGRSIVKDQPTTFRRYRMLRKLYEKGNAPLNVSDLSRDLMSATETIKSDGHTLQGLELITMELEEVDKWVNLNFRWYRGRVTDINPASPEYVFRVARALNNRGTKTARELVGNTGLDSYRVFSALSALEEAGFVRGGEKFHLQHQWQMQLSPKGREFWEGYFAKLYDFYSKRNHLPVFETEEAESIAKKKALEAYQKGKSI